VAVALTLPPLLGGR